jgi:hypothetical protein
MKRLLFFVCFSFLLSCGQELSSEKTIGKWIGKTVKIPKDVQLRFVNDQDSANYIADKKYKILVYMDSLGCTSCKFQANIWKKYINEMGNNVEFIFWFTGKNTDELLNTLRLQRFRYHFYIDEKDKINQQNNFSTEIMLQCFLLNRKNEVLMIGNPVFNPNIWKFYKKIICPQQ